MTLFFEKTYYEIPLKKVVLIPGSSPIYTPLQVLSLVEGSQFFHEIWLQFLLSLTPFRIKFSIPSSLFLNNSPLKSLPEALLV